MQQKEPMRFNAVVVSLRRSQATVIVPRLGLEEQCRYLDVEGCGRYRLEGGRGEHRRKEEPASAEEEPEDELEEPEERTRQVTLLASAEEDASTLAVLSELDVVMVQLEGSLGRRPQLKARLVLPESEPSSPSSPQSLARSASQELVEVLSRTNSANPDDLAD